MAEEHYNLDELVPPSFVNETYIVDILRQVEDDPELHVINYDIKPGSKAGDHYASIMFKIIATYGTRGKIINERRLIFKTVPEAEGHKKELLDNLPAFKNEIFMYTKVLPEMEKILKEHGEEGWWPKLVYSQAKPFVLMFDDLTVEKYEVVHEPLDYEHIGMIVEKIGKYHALSKVLLERGFDEGIKDLRLVFTPEMRGMFVPILKLAENATASVKTWQGYEEIAVKFERFVENMFDMQLKMMSKDNSAEFNVLNHGDFHIRNLMFQKAPTGELSKVLFLDFQMPNYNMPAFDLVGLLTTMGNEEVRRMQNDVIKMYHRHLLANLKNYGFTGELPSVIDIHTTLLKMSGQYFFYMFVFSPILKLKGFELGEMFNPSAELLNALTEVMKIPAVVDDLKLVLNRFDEIGLFE